MDSGKSMGLPLRELATEQLKKIENAYENNKDLLGIPTGFRELNDLTLGWQAPELIIIAARPSQGKTALGLDTAKAAARNGGRVYFASLEMSAEQLTTRLLSSECGVSGRVLRLGRFPEGDWSRIVAASSKIANLEILIDDTSAISEMELARRVRRVKPSLLVVDYLQLMRSAQKADRKDLEIANITAGLKALAKEINIPVILLSQLNREIEKRRNPRPKLSDLRESGAIEQDADVVLFIYRNPKNPGMAELICRKQRNGPLGTIELAFREELASFADLAKE
jgi:replicative DNA helicase